MHYVSLVDSITTITNTCFT